MARRISGSEEDFARQSGSLTESQTTVLEFLLEHLPDAWEIFIRPHLNGLQPDFVLLHPEVGIAAYEVEDRDLCDPACRLHPESSADWSLLASDVAGKSVKPWNPVAKALRTKKAILNLYCPGLGIRAIRTPQAKSVITSGVIFPKAGSRDVRNLFAAYLRSQGLLDTRKGRYHPVLGGDTLTPDGLATMLPDVHRKSSAFMSTAFAAELRQWLTEPDASTEHREPLALDQRQTELIQSRTTGGYRRIKGPAGSGKSLVLAGRAAQLAAEGKDVLVISFNITLWHYLRDLAARHWLHIPVERRKGERFSSRITWMHFHEWCKSACGDANMNLEYRGLFAGRNHGQNLKALLEVDLPALVARALAREGSKSYDAVLVDEGQDFILEWWKLLGKVVRAGGERLLVADRTQDLYGRGSFWTEVSSDSNF